MQEPSNKNIAVLLFVLLLVSISGLLFIKQKEAGFFGITGFASTDVGTATLTLNTQASIRFAFNAVDFGSGRVNTSAGNQYCILDSNGTNDSNKCIGFIANTSYFQLENDGSTNIYVQLVSSKSASTFLGGTNPVFRYTVFNNETNSCRNGTGGTGTVGQSGGGTSNCTAAGSTAGNCTVNPMGWTDVNTTGSGTTICYNLTFTDLADSIGFDINMSIPYDTPSGAKSAVFTATATTTT